MKNEISSAARKIARLHNDRLNVGFGGNGFIIIGRDGTGGAWYRDNSYFPSGIGDNIKVSIGRERMTGADAQVLLDNTSSENDMPIRPAQTCLCEKGEWGKQK